jgi:hypothetical protein
MIPMQHLNIVSVSFYQQIEEHLNQHIHETEIHIGNDS